MARPGILIVLAATAIIAGCSEKDSDSVRIERLRDTGNVEALGREVGGDDSRVGRMAVRAMGRIGPKALPQVKAALADKRGEIREEAAIVYARVAEPEAAAPLAGMARTDPVPTVRAAAVTSLGHLLAFDEMEAVIAALEDPDPMVRQRAGDAVARMTGRSYDLGSTPEERARMVAHIRERWRLDANIIREYFRRQSTPPAKQ